MTCRSEEKKANEFFQMEAIFEKYSKKKESLVAVLQDAKDIYNWLSFNLLAHISRAMDIQFSKVMGVATFYTQFKTKPAGKHLILLCQGTACHVNGSADIEAAVKNYLKTDEGEITQNGLFSYNNAACLGCCSLSPVMMVGDRTYGNLTKDIAVEILKNIERAEALNYNDAN
jgi:NADH-quinone oxidoreductase subunit E